MAGEAVTVDYAALRSAADKATPGPWRHPPRSMSVLTESVGYCVASDLTEANATYVAAVSPDVVLALLDENERLRDLVEATVVVVECSDPDHQRLREVEGERDAARADAHRCMDALYYAWTIIANAHEGDWHRAQDEWHQAAERWRDKHFHPLLEALRLHDAQAAER